MNGLELVRQVSGLRPFVGTVIISGRARLSPDDLPGDTRFLAKPYAAAELLGKAAEAMRVCAAKWPGAGS